MTESKWALVFLMIFLVLVFRFEYKVVLLSQLIFTKNVYNMQLDTTLTDVLDTVYLFEENGSFFFYEPDEVMDELEKQMFFGFEVWQNNGKACGQWDNILLFIIYEPDGFYYFEPEMNSVSKKIAFSSTENKGKTEEIEVFMEKRIGDRFLKKQKPGRVMFSFPKSGHTARARAIHGTGLLMLYEADISYLGANRYERFILSGASVE